MAPQDLRQPALKQLPRLFVKPGRNHLLSNPVFLNSMKRKFLRPERAALLLLRSVCYREALIET